MDVGSIGFVPFLFGEDATVVKSPQTDENFLWLSRMVIKEIDKILVFSAMLEHLYGLFMCITNCRICRGRRVVAIAFGILESRFRVLLGTMEQRPKVVRDIVLTCGVLHMLRTH